MKIEEIKANIDQLKTVQDPTEEQKAELTSLEQQLQAETVSKTRFDELSVKDEALLTSEEVDELIQLGERFAEVPPAGTPPGPEGAKKYAGKYDTVEDLITGFQSSEEEARRISSSPEAISAIEDAYKESQRKVTKLVADKRKPLLPSPDLKPLDVRDLHEMTRDEYDAWEKQDKLAAHAWLSNATRKESLVQESRIKVLKKYKGWMAEINGIDEPSKELVEWDRIEKSRPDIKIHPDWPERIMVEMETNLGIRKPEPSKKPATILKPGFEAGKAGAAKSPAGKKLNETEFAALTREEQDAYLMAQAPTD